jgi:hypothetical protein
VFQTRKVAEILLTARSDSHEFAVVVFTGGGYGIARDGEFLPAYCWTDAQLDLCIEEFMRLVDIDFEKPADDQIFPPHGDRR